MKFIFHMALYLLLFFPSAPVLGKEDVKEFSIPEKDGEPSYILKLVYNDQGSPQYFFREILTPVCLDDVCKPVRINLYWDLLGNYTKFKVPDNEPLTKLDHKEFTPDDYDKLQQILSSENSLLKDFKMEELIDSATQNLSDAVDAVTGATKNTIKNEVIEGALYTCYTLWHLANGATRTEMENITAQNMDDNLLHDFLQSENFHYQYWAMDRVIGKEGKVIPEFLSDVLDILRDKNVFAARYALRKVSVAYFSGIDRQRWLWQTYLDSPYTLQMELLKKMGQLSLHQDIVLQLGNHLGKLNNEGFRRALEVLAAQGELPENVQNILTAYLSADEPEKAQITYQMMKDFPKSNLTLKHELNNYKTNK